MKIAFFSAYQNKLDRGAEIFSFQLSEKLKKNHHVILFSDNILPKKRWPFFWRLYLDPSGISVLWFTLKNLKKVWKEKYEIVIPVNGGWQPALLRLITWVYGGKMIVIGHSGIGWDDLNNLWCFPDIFVSLSSSANNWVKKVNPFVKTTFIPDAIDLKKFSPDGKKAIIGLEKPIILAVGALEKTKRFDLTIKAVANLRKASLLILGDGAEKDYLDKLGNELLNGRFQLKKVEYKSIDAYYRGCNLFTLPSSHSYSFEMVILEALASNLPVVVNEDPIRKEIIGNAGLLVNPNDINKYSEILDNALKKNWNDLPKIQAKKYSWDTITKKYEDIFSKLINV